MIELKQFRKQKESILTSMQTEWEETSKEDRYYSPKDIQNCKRDLDKYLDRLMAAQDSEKKQKEIAKSIRWIYKQLSKFNEEEDGYEFLYGFIYNGYTEELTRFILDAAFAAGFKKDRPKTIKIQECYFDYSPYANNNHQFLNDILSPLNFDYSPYANDDHKFYTMQVSLFKGKTGVILNLNYRTGNFEYESNPLGNSYGIPVFNLRYNVETCDLSFDVLSTGSYKSFIIKPTYEIDKVFLKLISMLHGVGLPCRELKPNHGYLQIFTAEGMIEKFYCMSYDDEHNIIQVGNPDAGINLFIRYLDEQGEVVSKHQYPTPVITGEEFVVMDTREKDENQEPHYQWFPIEQLGYTKNQILVITKDRELTYTIQALPVIQEFLHEVIEKRKPFVPRYKKETPWP